MLWRRSVLLMGLLALFACVVTTVKQAEAADPALLVEGEDFARRPVGSNEITGAGYSGGAALKFTQDNTASHPINCSAPCNVVLMASGGQSGGQPTFRVNSEPAQALRSTTVMPYTFVVNLPAGERTIEVTAGNTGTGRNAILDVATFPASGSGGGTDTTPPDTTITSGPSGSLTGTTARFDFNSSETGSTFSCRLLPLESSRTPCTSPKTYTNLTVGTAYTFKVWAKDTAGNIDASPATRTFTPTGGSDTDTDGDGVPDSTDQCPNRDGPASNNGCPVTTPPTDWNCSGIPIKPGNDIDQIINDAPADSPTTFCVHAGTYQVSQVARLKAGDKLEGEPPGGEPEKVGPATKPAPVVFLEGNGTDTLLSALGANISIKWVDLSGASGTGRGAGAIAAGSANSKFLVQYARIHDNDCLGISNAKGQILDSEFFSNTEASACIGVNGSAIKGITQFEAGRLFVHREQGNGIWCDVGCDSDPERGSNGFYVHDSVVVGSGRAGIRYENSPTKAVIANNWIHGNGAAERRGGVDIRDSQNATVTNNVFGAATIDGENYPVNKDKIAVRATDSGRSDRVNLFQIDVNGNHMNTEVVIGCELRDEIVACSDNR